MAYKISIIVPVYNVEAYLQECLDSVSCQTYDGYECLLVDDGSTDASGRMCDARAKADPLHFRVLHKPNGGLSSARNYGMERATGDYIVFIDSDDFWCDAAFLSNLARCIEASGADVVQYGVRKYSTAQSCFTSGGNRNVEYLNGMTGSELLSELVASNNLQISAYSMALSREFVLSRGLFFVEGIKSEDIEWSLRLFSEAPTWHFMDDEVYAYRQNREGSITASIDYAHIVNYVNIIMSSLAVIDGCDGSSRSALLSYLLYHVLIVVGLAYRTPITPSQRSEVLSQMEDVFKRNVKGHALNKKVKVASRLARVIGCPATFRLVGLYLKNRGR